ncbi:cytochrome c biogenesis CcdA family protein [Saccharopolyspora sp. TS4A08]|uniref:Cytochrome c biogenesis CcdA family protein n=1 Tax=Saccharopolyspora ipomoeae TaxID=3042027 RepID=A0ABT6PJ20_9PSEU|nr:cytochrome c biogenesis CcdA family protein [Saccharopolyspora sp. TS4A08]MDI2027954.1 cytochrome c biogenesis CcdA family protein [Saccharopolyspora sp. TS4A08]
MNPTDIVISGPVVFAALVSCAAGALSFASPCVFPLVPGYVAYLAGLVGADSPAVTPAEAETKQRGRWRIAGAAALFVAGFSIVFIAATLAVLGLTDAIGTNSAWLQRLGGVITVLMGLVFLGLVPPLQRDVRLHRLPRSRGLIAAPLLGGVFGLGWTPCLSPTLAGVISLAVATDPSVASGIRGAVLIGAYCVGLGIPFVLMALGAQWGIRTAGWLRRHGRTVQRTGGALLVLLGLSLVTGLWQELLFPLQTTISTFELPL